MHQFREQGCPNLCLPIPKQSAQKRGLWEATSRGVSLPETIYSNRLRHMDLLYRMYFVDRPSAN
jgi:hypothetical protein